MRGSGNDAFRAETQAGLRGGDLPVGAGVPWCQALSCIEPSRPRELGLINPLRSRAAEVQVGSNSPEAAMFLSGWVGNGNLKVTSLPLEREESTCILGK